MCITILVFRFNVNIMPKITAKIPITLLIPNLVTILGLCFGLSAIRYALDEKWPLVCSLIIAAIITDTLDGKLARLLKASSNFGVQLDSLSDFVCFGVAPAMTLYIWSLHEIPRFGWLIALFFAICCALRLARFNVKSIEGDNNSNDNIELDKQIYHDMEGNNNFTGVPAPAAAAISLLPLIIYIEFGSYMVVSVSFVIILTAIMSLLMISTIPTPSLKGYRISNNQILPIMLLFGILIAFIIIDPWIVYIFSSITYMLYLPVFYFKEKRNYSGNDK